jgi:hypothetical protein
MIGEVSPAEMKDLREHLNECPDCRREYQEFVQLVLPQLSMSDEPVSTASSSTTESEYVLRARFLERAQAAGISFSPKALNPPENGFHEVAAVTGGKRIEMPTRKPLRLGLVYRGAIAAGLLVAAAVGGYMAAKGHGRPTTATADVKTTASKPSSSPVPGSQDFAAVSAQDARTIAELEAKLREANARLATERSAAEVRENERTALQQQIDVQKQALVLAQQQGQASDQAAASLKTQLSALQTRADAEVANSSLDQIKMKDLSTQISDLNSSLERERDMLSAGRDMRDMMAARNLHIVDVVDTDSNGKNRPAFGRIFFAENRQLVFYAYDLNEKRLEDARYDYRIWGQKEGQPRTARSLGIFYSDDKTQHRWVFKCEDPKTLSEIDSVFVTLEPSTTDPAHPKGPQMMYAYLRGQPNHP